MKKYLALLSVFGLLACSQDSGGGSASVQSGEFAVNFMRTNYDETLRQAHVGNKMLLLDFYAVW